MSTDTTAWADVSRYAIFEVGHEGLRGKPSGVFALDVSLIQQVIEPSGVAAVPLAPPDILGIVNHHGRIVTIFDPAPILGLPAQRREPGMQAILVRAPRAESPNPLGLHVLRIKEISPSKRLSKVEVQGGPCVSWVAKLERRLVHVVDLSALLERLSRQFAAAAAAEVA